MHLYDNFKIQFIVLLYIIHMTLYNLSTLIYFLQVPGPVGPPGPMVGLLIILFLIDNFTNMCNFSSLNLKYFNCELNNSKLPCTSFQFIPSLLLSFHKILNKWLLYMSEFFFLIYSSGATRTRGTSWTSWFRWSQRIQWNTGSTSKFHFPDIY